MLPDDPILAELLQTGGFETVLRIGGAKGSAALSTAAILQRYPDLTGAGAAYLSERAIAAHNAGRSIADLESDSRIDYGNLPRVPSQGVPGAEPGNIVFTSKSIAPGSGPHGTDLGIDTTIVYENPPTYDELFESIREQELQREKSYERLAQWLTDNVGTVTTIVSGAYVVE